MGSTSPDLPSVGLHLDPNLVEELSRKAQEVVGHKTRRWRIEDAHLAGVADEDRQLDRQQGAALGLWVPLAIKPQDDWPSDNWQISPGEREHRGQDWPHQLVKAVLKHGRNTPYLRTKCSVGRFGETRSTPQLLSVGELAER